MWISWKKTFGFCELQQHQVLEISKIRLFKLNLQYEKSIYSLWKLFSIYIIKLGEQRLEMHLFADFEFNTLFSKIGPNYCQFTKYYIDFLQTNSFWWQNLSNFVPKV